MGQLFPLPVSRDHRRPVGQCAVSKAGEKKKKAIALVALAFTFLGSLI